MSPAETISVLHVPGPRLDGRGDWAAQAAGVVAHTDALRNAGAPVPDLVVVSGDVTASATPSGMEHALRFLTQLRDELTTVPGRLVTVPGRGDISLSKCRAHFALCEDEEVPAREPYYPKLERFAAIFADLYADVPGAGFGEHQPWSEFGYDDLRLSVAAFNSTWSMSHLPEHDGGSLGQRQTAAFARWLGGAVEAGRLRLGVMNHAPVHAGTRLRLHHGMLHDTDQFNRHLAPRLHLLFHGAGEGARHGDAPLVELAGGLLAHQASPTGVPELVEIGAEEVRVWRGPEAPVVARPHGFTGLVDVFGAPDVPAGPVEVATVPVTAGPVRTSDPHQILLDRVHEVCQVRFADARINRIEADPAYLLITRSEGGIVSQIQVGVVCGSPDRADLTDFLGAAFSGSTAFESYLVYDSDRPPGDELHAEARRRAVRIQSFLEFQGLRGLFDLSRYVRKQNQLLASSRAYAPDLYVPQRFRDLDAQQARRGDTLLEELLELADDPHGRFVLLLGEFGTGKTFALRELAQRIPERYPHLMPLYIELGRQERPNTVPAMVASHLANHGEDRIDLRAFHYLLEQGRLVLLFDGFDELAARLTYDTAADHLSHLIQAAKGKAKIFVTSRTQHFRSHRQVRTALGERVESLPQHRILSLRRFDHGQIEAFLVNHFGGDTARARERLELVGRIANLEELAMNPRMLGFIASLEAAQLRRVAESRVTLSPADLYREILHAWLRFEAERPGAAGLTVDELMHAVTRFATTLWTERTAALPLSRLTEVAETLTSVTARVLSTDQRVHAVGSGSLLVRLGDTDEAVDEVDDGEDEPFTFIHSSIMEWLVAARLAEELAEPGADPVLLSERRLTDLARNFLCDLADHAHCRRWIEHVRDHVDVAQEVAHFNARRIAAALHTPYSRNMRGAILRGEDLSERQWPGVDLRGADLRDALLSRVDLSGADLSGADLTGARLENARLNRVDLTDAVLDRTRLLHVDLAGAQWRDSRWGHAALVEVSADPLLLDHAVATGAVVSGRHRVEAQLYPASVGVRVGFDQRIGRLPASVAYHGTGTIVAIGSDDGGVLLCDSATGQPIRTLSGHSARVYAVAFEPGGERLASGSADGTVRIWNVATGEPLGVTGSHHHWVWPMEFAPQGGLLVTWDAAGVLRMWDTATGRPVWRFDVADDIAYSVAFHPDGDVAAVAFRSGAVRVLSTVNGRLLAEHRICDRPVYRVAYSPDGRYLAVGGGDGTLQLWDGRGRERLRVLEEPSGRVYSLAFHPTRPLLACGDTGDAVHVFDTDTGRPVYGPLRHAAHLYWVAFSPDGRWLASGDRSGTVQLWDAETGEPHRTLDEHTGSVWPFEFRPDSAQLAISDDQNITRLWNSDEGRCEHTIAGHGRQVTSVSFDRTGRMLATRCSDGLVRLWDTRIGEPVEHGRGDHGLSSFGDVVLHPVEPILVTVSNEHRISLRNLVTGAFERHFSFDREIWAIAFDPRGEVLATANDDDTVGLWRRTTGQQIHVLREHRGRVRSIAYSPDGSLLATGCDDGRVRVWLAAEGRLLATLTGHTDRVYSVAFSPDGGLLVSASLDGRALVWNPEDGTLQREFTEHNGQLWTVAFHPDGRVATAGDDLAIRMWDPDTGVVDRVLRGHQRSVWTLAFSPDGSLLASGGDDGTTRLWRIDDDPHLELILSGLPEGWAAMTSDGQYKVDGRVNGHLWYVLGACRFELGQLDAFLPQVRRLPLGAPFRPREARLGGGLLHTARIMGNNGQWNVNSR